MLQTINGITTNYVLDLNTGLTQVLQDGTNTYLYGINRVAQSTAEQSEFFLADALGSARTLSNSLAEITLTQSYSPFGEVLNTSGEGQTDYAFTGELYDPNTGLVFLRARYYSASDGRFTSRDVWEGDERMPMSYNAWMYGYANPVRFVDPLGLCPDCGISLYKYESFLPTQPAELLFGPWAVFPKTSSFLPFDLYHLEWWYRDIHEVQYGQSGLVELCLEIGRTGVKFYEQPISEVSAIEEKKEIHRWRQDLIIGVIYNRDGVYSYKNNG